MHGRDNLASESYQWPGYNRQERTRIRSRFYFMLRIIVIESETRAGGWKSSSQVLELIEIPGSQLRWTESISSNTTDETRVNLREDITELIGKENGIKINKVRWLSKLRDEATYELVVLYLDSKKDADQIVG